MEIKFTASNNGVEYTFKTCTAIAKSIGSDVRQDALLVTAYDSGEEYAAVVFGYDMPEDEADVENIYEDCAVWDSYCDTLETVELTD